MIARHQITFTEPAMPAALSTLQTQLDTILAAAWGANELRRTVTLVWANQGGYTTAKENAVARMLEYYREAGLWNVDWTSGEAATMVATFRR